ncbi:MAG: class I SAM-dependent methyltransferase [Patescibacteria group bacterium]|jgi:ubiquinone/menaquinone biosynthesis C-methylase UbiE
MIENRETSFLATNEEKPFNRKTRIEDFKDPLKRREAQTNWSFEETREILNLPIDDMKGMCGLDIGSGSEGVFSKEAEKHGIEVISLNPALGTLFSSNERKKHHGDVISGLVQEMPFKDDTFDFEISYLAIPFFLQTHEQEYRDTFSEVIRTLKPGGSAYFYPILSLLQEDKTFRKIISDFREQADIVLESVPGRDYRMIITKHPEKE